MTHKRETLLAAVQSQISDAATSCSTRVYRGRGLQFEDAELPACAVYQGDEESNFNDFGASYKSRFLRVNVELHQKSDPANVNAPAIETALNVLAEEVENALEADFSLGGTAISFEHQQTETEIEPGEVDRGVIRLGLVVHYRSTRLDAGA